MQSLFAMASSLDTPESRASALSAPHRIEELLNALCLELPGLSKQVERIEIRGARVVIRVATDEAATNVRALLSAVGRVEVVTDADAQAQVTRISCEEQLLFPFARNGGTEG
jgi:hypothetical protein